MDGKTRPSHAALNGVVYRHDDPVWSSIYPPNGFNCRCRVTAISESGMKRRGLTAQSSAGHVQQETVETGVNKRTGEIRTADVTVVKTGRGRSFRTDPGFNHSPGTGLAAALKRKESE
ncbi:TPA: minor capsid protein, partial [Pseudomonas aeruginosa]|nr:minor capsid protein [Pseudomonas aeruginosa]